MVYDHYSFIEFAVVNPCKLSLMIMNHYFTAYSLLDQLIVYLKEKHYTSLNTVFYSFLRHYLQRKVCI